MQNRELIEQQIADFHKKANARPGQQDNMGMVGFMSSLLAAKLQTLLVQSDMEELQQAKQKEPLPCQSDHSS